MVTLKRVLRANAASCIIFALIFLLKPTEVATFLSGDAPAQAVLLQILGVILMLNGVHLLWASVQELPGKLLVLYFSIGDFVWVFASISLVVSKLWITNVPGITATMVVATLVGTLGVLQMIERKNMSHENR